MLLQSTPFNTPLALRTTPINKAVSLPFTNLRSTPQATPSATSFVSKPAQPQAGAVTMTTKPQELLGLCQDGGSSSPGLKLDKIMRSLESGFSNEVDLVMNILLMISDNGDITIEQVSLLFHLYMLTQHTYVCTNFNNLTDVTGFHSGRWGTRWGIPHPPWILVAT